MSGWFKDIKNSTDKRFCCYKGCSSDQLKTRNGAISFFGYPIKDTERCSIWISFSGREEFRYLTPRELQHKRICELHFQPNMFSNEFKTKLIKTAVPVDYKTISQEPIQIDDDDVSDEGESGIVSEASSNNNIACENDQENRVLVVTGKNSSNMNELDVTINERNIFSQSTLEGSDLEISSDDVTSVSPSNIVSVPTNEESSVQIQKATLDTQQFEKQACVAKCVAGERKKSEKQISTKNISNSTEKSLERRKFNTKFHNLPPQTTQSDFYFQHCPTEETNSFSEAPDGELPLFVQQDSLASLADERANSGMSEPPAKKRKKDKDDNDDLADQMRDTMKQLLNITTLLNNGDDEFQLFGKSVALQLKKMSLCTALTVQAKIQHLLSQFRINEIQKKSKEKSTENISETEEIRVGLNATSEEDKLGSPQLSLNCVSETSENQDTEIGLSMPISHNRCTY